MTPAAEPIYAGRGLQAWTALLDDPHPFRRQAAAHALGAIGPDAGAAVRPLTHALGDENSSVRAAAASALGNIGPKAVPAVPAMIAALRRAKYFDGGFIGVALAKFGAAAVPLLIEATREPRGNFRSESILTLRRIGPGARMAVGRLGEVARDPADRDRVAAAFALWSIARRPEAVPVLAAAVADPDEYVAGTACDHLGSIGPEAWRAVPDLIRGLDDKRELVRNPAANALGQIGPKARAALPKILHLPGTLHSGRTSFATAVAAIGRDEVPTLIEGLDDPADYPRWTAAEALGRIGPGARAAVPTLARMMTSAREMDRVVAATALWRVAHDGRVVSVLAEAARPAAGRHLGVRSGALDALGEIGPAAGEAVPTLIDLLAALGDINAYKVAEALGRIGPGARDAVAALERASAHAEDDSVRMNADLALWRITQGEKGVAELIKELRGGSDLEKTMARSTLGQIGRGAGPAVPALVELFRDGHQDPIDVAVTLGQIGPPANSALPHIIEIYNDEALIYKDRVAEAIYAIDPVTATKFGIR